MSVNCHLCGKELPVNGTNYIAYYEVLDSKGQLTNRPACVSCGRDLLNLKEPSFILIQE